MLGARFGIALTLDAEEAERLELSLLLLDVVLASDLLAGYAGFGLAVQAYQKRALRVLSGLWARCASRATHHRASRQGRVLGQRDQACAGTRPAELPCLHAQAEHRRRRTSRARALLEQPRAHLSAVRHSQRAHRRARLHSVRQRRRPFEFQRLHGMGEELYSQVIARTGLGHAVPRLCAGRQHEDLLPYLVRRLLENGANTSFVNRIVNDERAGRARSSPTPSRRSMR